MLQGPVARGTIYTSLVLGGRLLIQAGTLLLLARVLGAESFGIFAGIASLAILLGTMSTFGTQLVFLGEVSKNAKSRDRVLAYAIPSTLVCSGFLLLLYLLLVFFWFSLDWGLFFVALAVGLSEIIIQPLYGLISTEQHAENRVARAQIMQAAPLLIRLLVVMVVWFFELVPSLDFYSAGYLFASVTVFIIGLFILQRPWPSCHQWHFPAGAQARKAFGYAVVNFSKSGPTEFDKTIAIKILGVEMAGIYAAASRVVGAVSLPITAMLLSALPRLFKETGSKNNRSGRFLKWMYCSALLYAFLLSGLLWVGAPYIEKIFGQEYMGVSEAVRLLSIAAPGLAMRQVAGNVLMASDRPLFRAGLEFLGIMILAVTGFSLAPDLGFYGLALGVVLSEWSAGILGLVVVVILRNSEEKKVV